MAQRFLLLVLFYQHSSWATDCFNNSPEIGGNGGAELMNPFLSAGAKLSRVTVGYLEDIGYGVNYDAADELLPDDFGPACQCGSDTRNLSKELFEERSNQETPTRRRTLSDANLKKATEYGHGLLAPTGGHSNSDGPYYTRSSATVYIKQDEAIHAVTVKAE